MIVEDPFPQVTLVNIVVTNLRAVLNAKNDGRFSPNARIRKIWIPKQYLIHKDDLATKGRVFAARENEKNLRYLYLSKQEMRKRNSPNKRMFL